MKKRIFAMLMAAAMMLSMAACGNGAEEKKTENSAGTERTELRHLYMEVMITRVSIRQWMSMVRSIF
jgi:uncharacterized lipoprotein YehR (DUF1307 family)